MASAQHTEHQIPKTEDRRRREHNIQESTRKRHKTSIKSTDVIGAKHERRITPVGARIVLLCFARFLRYNEMKENLNRRRNECVWAKTKTQVRCVRCSKPRRLVAALAAVCTVCGWLMARAVMSGNYTIHIF